MSAYSSKSGVTGSTSVTCSVTSSSANRMCRYKIHHDAYERLAMCAEHVICALHRLKRTARDGPCKLTAIIQGDDCVFRAMHCQNAAAGDGGGGGCHVDRQPVLHILTVRERGAA